MTALLGGPRLRTHLVATVAVPSFASCSPTRTAASLLCSPPASLHRILVSFASPLEQLARIQHRHSYILHARSYTVESGKSAHPSSAISLVGTCARAAPLGSGTTRPSHLTPETPRGLAAFDFRQCSASMPSLPSSSSRSFSPPPPSFRRNSTRAPLPSAA